jgi:hypothetical protein
MLLLMASVIFFSNCSETIQITIGGAYFLPNIFYWGLALLVESKDTWNMSRYTMELKSPTDEKAGSKTESMTEVFWLASQHTERTHWLRRANIAPITDDWDT